MKEIRNTRIIEARNIKAEISELKSKTSDFFDKMEVLNWNELNIDKTEEGSINFTVTLSDILIEEFDGIKEFEERESDYREIFHHIIWGHPDDSCDELEWSVSISPNLRNRIHINGAGLPFSFREKGLGKKIYKRILKEVGYISTRKQGAYKYSHLLWESITRDNDFFCFVSENLIIAVLKDNIPDDLINILEELFVDVEECFFDPRFCQIYKTKLHPLKIHKHCI